MRRGARPRQSVFETSAVASRAAHRHARARLNYQGKPQLLRAYVKRWKAEVGVFFEGVGPDAPDEELRRIAPGYPVFQLRDP